MDDFKITKDMVCPEFTSDYLNVFDYRYAEGKHYYNATRRRVEDIVAIKDVSKSFIPHSVAIAFL